MPALLGNTLFIAPTAAVLIDDSALNGLTPGGSSALCILGVANGGQPQTPIRLSSAEAANNILKGGPLLQACQRAFATSPDIPGAPLVFAIRVNQATPSLLDLKSGATTVMTLTSVDYGSQTKQISVSILDSPTGAPAKQITVRFGQTINQRQTVSRRAIAVQYIDATATYTSVTLGITGTTLTVTLTPTAAPGTPIVKTIDLTQATTLQAVVNALNAMDPNMAAAVDTVNPADPSLYLDETAAPIAIRFAAAQTGTAIPELWANRQAILDFFNNQSGFVTATAGALRRTPDNLVGYVFLGSDDNGTNHHAGTDYGVGASNVVLSDWTAAMAVAGTIDVSVITVATPDQVVHQALQGHVDSMSTLSGMHERVAVIGPDVAETMASVESRAASIRDPRVMLVYPGGLDIDPNSTIAGQTIAVPGYIMAAQLAGMLCAGNVQDPLTHRYISAVGLETRLTKDQIDELLLNGICPLQVVQGRGFRVVQSRSTWTADNNFRKNEISVMRASDELAKRVRNACDDQLVGQIVSPTTLNLAVTIVEGVLSQAAREGMIVGNPAFRNIIVTGALDTVTVSFECNIAIPANYVLITAHLRAFSGTVTA